MLKSLAKNLVTAIVTGGYVGFLPKMPGTFGSLLAFPICMGLLHLTTRANLHLNITSLTLAEQEILAILLVQAIACLVIFLLGLWLVKIYLKTSSAEDPKEVVIDEIAGQMLTIILSVLCNIFAYQSTLKDLWGSTAIDIFFLIILPFVSFRFFDILKPWPINWLDKNVKGALGVMVDDIAAAIFATVSCYMITFLMI